jgi:putative two-component system response regulator
MPHQKAASIISDGAGRHFDPDVAAAFTGLEKEFAQIAERYADTPAEEPLEAMTG